MWIVISILIILITTIWWYLKHVYSYWERHGFDFAKPKIPFGNLHSVAVRERSFGMAISDLYESTTKPFLGIYLFFRPAILVCDPALAQNILIKNFTSFHDRGVYVDDNDPKTQNLFALEGQTWKKLRNKLAPTFTSGKLKNMFSTLEATGRSMQDYLDTLLPDSETSKVIEMKEISTRYAVDIIASTIFGLEVNSFTDQDNAFFKVREAASSQQSTLQTLQLAAIFLCPSVIKWFKWWEVKDPVMDFMLGIVKDTIEYREKNQYVRKDLMQSLIQLRNSGKINIDDEIWDIETSADNLKSMSIELCAAQASIFYIAGLETSAATMAFCLYELGQNADVLAKVLEDIEASLARHDGKITYDSIRDMTYLELCLKETLRKYPGLPILNRICTEDFQIPDTDQVITKGTPIIFSTIGMQRDPKYFPNPLKFDPERFRPSQGDKEFNEAAYLPFGEGPRHCIGIRLGKMNALMGIVMVLTKFKIEPVEIKEMVIDNFSVALMPKGGVNLKMSKKVR